MWQVPSLDGNCDDAVYVSTRDLILSVYGLIVGTSGPPIATQWVACAVWRITGIGDYNDGWENDIFFWPDLVAGPAPTYPNLVVFSEWDRTFKLPVTVSDFWYPQQGYGTCFPEVPISVTLEAP